MPTLTGAQMLGNGVFQFSFSNTPGATFTVLSTTNLSLPMNYWTVVGAATNTGPSVFTFTTPPTSHGFQTFYTVRSFWRGRMAAHANKSMIGLPTPSRVT